LKKNPHQVRAKVLNGDLEAAFERWHPGYNGKAQTKQACDRSEINLLPVIGVRADPNLEAIPCTTRQLKD